MWQTIDSRTIANLCPATHAAFPQPSSSSLIIYVQYFYSALNNNLLFQYGTTLLPPPSKLVKTLNLKHGKPFDVMDLL